MTSLNHSSGPLENPAREPRVDAFRPSEVFDRTGAVARPPLWRLGNEVLSLLFYHPPLPHVAGIPAGRGHVVLVVPAFLTGDLASRRLRRFLERCGYRCFGWQQGLNWGPTAALRHGLRRRVAELHRIADEPISVVGISLGGLLAWDVAHDAPRAIRQVITVASPLRFPTASSIEPLVRMVARLHGVEVDIERLASPVSVPVTALYTRRDAVVAWETCRACGPGAMNVDVSAAAHLTICRHPDVLRLIAERLAARPPAPGGSGPA
jgi:pimeloyl-ACP methyl ester carboxylesterase